LFLIHASLNIKAPFTWNNSWNWTILVTLKLLMFSSFHHEIEQFLWHWNYSCFLHFITKLNNSCDIETTHVFFISSRNWTILVTLKQLMFSSFHYEIEQFLWHWNYSCFLHFIMKSNNSCGVETTHVFFISLWNWTILVTSKILSGGEQMFPWVSKAKEQYVRIWLPLIS
jgi:hypothetical protein